MQIKNDNDFVMDKIMLRSNNLPDGDVRVLDCFSGSGVIWRGVKQKTGRDIKVLPIDKRRDIGLVLAGDNVEFLYSLDLSKFNVVDLDAYGVPYEQIRALVSRGYSGVVFVTFIQSAMGTMPIALLEDIGFTREMIKKTPTLFGLRGWECFKRWLSNNGVTKITHRSKNRKHYLMMLLNS